MHIVVGGEVAINRLEPVQTPAGCIHLVGDKDRLCAIGERVGEHALCLRGGGRLAGWQQHHKQRDEAAGTNHQHPIVRGLGLLVKGPQREKVKGEVGDKVGVLPIFARGRGPEIIEGGGGGEEEN